jgi:hypothetical protein
MPRAYGCCGAVGRDPCIWQRQCQVLAVTSHLGNVRCHSIPLRLVLIRRCGQGVPCVCSLVLGQHAHSYDVHGLACGMLICFGRMQVQLERDTTRSYFYLPQIKNKSGARSKYQILIIFLFLKHFTKPLIFDDAPSTSGSRRR